jgi:hypothetical protein
MKVFNDRFKQLLSVYASDAACNDALIYIEQSTPPPAQQPWDRARVIKFIAGLRFTVKKRNAYFGYLLDKVNIVVVNPDSKTFRTMAVDGKNNLYINPEFAVKLITGVEQAAYDQDTIDRNLQDNKHNEDVYNTLPDGEKVFLGIIAHELMHIFKDHVARMGDRTAIVKIGEQKCTLWNIATDIEINDELIYKWGYYIIKNGIITKPDGTFEMSGKTYACRGKTPERIYRELLADIPPADPNDQDSDDGDSDDTIAVGDIVYDKATGKYGEVVSIDNKGNVKIGELTKEEAKARAQ